MKNILILFLLLITQNVFSEDINRNENAKKYQLKFKVTSFEGNLDGIGFIEGETVKPLLVYDGIVSNEILYTGNSKIRFVKIPKNETEKNPKEIILDKIRQLEEKLKNISIKYNSLNDDLSKILDRINAEDRKPNSTEQIFVQDITSSINDLQSQMSTISSQIDFESQKIIEENRMQLKKDNLSKKESKFEEIKSKKSSYNEIASFEIQSKDESYIFVLNQTNTQLFLIPIKDSEDVFPFGTYQFLNFCKEKIELSQNDKKYVIPQKSSFLFNSQPNAGPDVNAKLRFFSEEISNFSLNINLMYDQNSRNLIFLIPSDSENSGFKFKVFHERKIQKTRKDIDGTKNLDG
jgi:hypothetical protein